MAKNHYSEEAKQISKESVCEATMLLLREKRFSDITITEIAKKAGVSRNAVYRNFNSKEEIISYLVFDVTERFRKEVDETAFYDYRSYLISLFTHLKKYSYMVKILDNADISYFVKDIFLKWKIYPAEKLMYDDYARVYRNSALFEVYLHWIRTGEKETPSELANIVLHIISEMNDSI